MPRKGVSTSDVDTPMIKPGGFAADSAAARTSNQPTPYIEGGKAHRWCADFPIPHIWVDSEPPRVTTVGPEPPRATPSHPESPRTDPDNLPRGVS